MKKYLTLSNVLACCAFLLAILAFAFMFTDQLSTSATVLGKTTTGTVSFNDAFFSDGGSVVGFIGYLLVLIGGLCACSLNFFLKKSNVKLLAVVIASLVVIVGGVLIFLLPVFVNNNTGAKGWDLGGLASGTAFSLTVTAIIAAIAGIVSGLLSCCSALLAKK